MSERTPWLLATLALASGLTLATANALTQPADNPGGLTPTQVAALDYALRPRQIAPEVWVIEGAVEDFARTNGCNIINTGFITTPQGTLVLNTGPSRRYGEQQRATIERLTGASVQQVVNLNLHPDYFFGNQAWAGVPTLALAGTQNGQRAEGKAYEDNLFRLCGDWMLGTEHQPAAATLTPGPTTLGGHRLEWLRLSGHTDDDLVLIDHSSHVVFAGGLVFADRVPTTPHAHIGRWLASLDTLEARVRELRDPVLVPSHGPVRRGLAGLAQTRDWLRWLDQTLRESAEQGLDLGEVQRLPLPERFATWAAQPAEYVRTVHHLYPAYEARALRGVTPTAVTPR